MKFIHLSDLHIHTDDDNNREARSVLSFVSKSYPEHQVIVTGDITDDGAEAQYDNAYAMLKEFTNRIFVCPGNHDYGAAGNFYSYERAVRFDDVLARQLKQGGTFKGDSTPVVNVVGEGATQIMLIALDSNLETEQPFDFACGEIGESQLRALDTILAGAAASTMVKVLFFHHHPFIVNDPFMELKDARALARTVYGRVDVMLFGHKHEMKQWKKTWGTRYILASDNSPGKHFAKEITIEGTDVSVKEVAIVEPGAMGASAARAAKAISLEPA